MCTKKTTAGTHLIRWLMQVVTTLPVGWFKLWTPIFYPNPEKIFNINLLKIHILYNINQSHYYAKQWLKTSSFNISSSLRAPNIANLTKQHKQVVRVFFQLTLCTGRRSLSSMPTKWCLVMRVLASLNSNPSSHRPHRYTRWVIRTTIATKMQHWIHVS